MIPRATVRLLFHPEFCNFRGGVHLTERRFHVHREFRHDRSNRGAHQPLGPRPHGVFFLLSRDLSLCFLFAVEHPNGLLVRVDRHKFLAIPLDPVFEFRLRSRHT